MKINKYFKYVWINVVKRGGKIISKELKTEDKITAETLQNLKAEIIGEIQAQLYEIESQFNEELTKEIDAIDLKINALSEVIGHTANIIALNKANIEEHVQTQEEIIKSMIRRFYEETARRFDLLTTDMKTMKNEMDTISVSFMVNEKRLIDLINDTIKEEIRKIIVDKEREILMRLWIKELKEIVKDFEKIKKQRPKQFALTIDEIADVIESFKEKLQ